MTWYRSKAVHRVHHFNKWVLLIVLILITVISLGGRVLLGKIDYFKPEIEQLLDQYGFKGIELDNIHGEWNGLHPLVKINGASLSIPGDSHALSVSELEISFKLFKSLISSNLEIRSINLAIEKLVLVRNLQGDWSLNDIPLQNGTDKTDTSSVSEWLNFIPDNVSVDIRMMQIQDRLNSREYLIQDSALLSSRRNQSLSLEFTARLPATLGSSVRVLMSGNSSQQQIYVQSENLNIVEWSQLVSTKNEWLHSALVDLKSWVELENYHLQQITSDLWFSEVKIKHNPELQKPLSFSLRQKSQNLDELWRIDTQIDSIVKGDQPLPGIQAQILIKELQDVLQQKPLLWIDAMSISSLSLILSDVIEDEQFQLYLRQLQPTAFVRNIVAQMDFKNPQNSSVSFDFDRINIKAYQAIPGVQGISGRVVAKQGNAVINLKSKDVTLDFGSLFRDPLALDELTSNLTLNYSDGSILIDSPTFSLKNADLDLQGRLWLEIPKSGTPFLSLRSDYANGDGKSTPKYLPVSIMSPALVKWLDESIQEGFVERGDLIYHGRLEPFYNFRDNQSGEFEALFHLTQPRVKFLPDWPDVSEGQLTASFHNMGMQIDTAGTFFSTTRFDKVSVSIPDFSDSTLFIRGTTQTPASTILPTLSAMPVLNVFDQVESLTRKVAGNVQANVQITIPLDKENISPIVSAQAKLKQAAIEIPDWMVNFDNMVGEFSLKDNQIMVPELKGKYYGDNATLSISTDRKRDRTRFQLSGNLHSQNLTTLLPDFLKGPVSGRSDWDVQLSIDNKSDVKVPFIEVSAQSNLLGSHLSFPPPFQLKPDDKGAFNFEASVSHQNNLKFNVGLENRVEAGGFIDLESDSLDKLGMLGIELGKNALTQESDVYHSTSGIHLNGHMELLDWVKWVNYIDQYFEKGDEHTNGLLSMVQSVDVQINEFKLGSQSAKDAKIKLKRQSDRLTGSIDSSLAIGNLEIPFKASNLHPYKASLEYLKLSKPVKEETQRKLSIAVNEMPNFEIESDNLYFEDKNFEKLVLRTHAEQDKFSIDQLDFQRDNIQLKSSGFWQLDNNNNEHVSVFNITVQGENFGKTIDELGFGESIRGGVIDFDGQLGWGGKLYDLDWSTVIGEVHLNLENGYLRNVEPGAGRFVGLLSFNTLPRRLFLDFGDVLREGTQFEKIKGTFNIKGEIMETQDAFMDGPSALVEIIGNANIRDKTYDQTMNIYPKVGDTIPVIGGIAAGSAVGWGLLLLNKLFNDPIDKSVKIEYKVTGSWDEPVVTLIEKPQPENKPEEDSFDFSDDN